MKTILSLAALTLLGGTATAANESDFYMSAGGGIYRLEADGFDDRAPTMKLTGGYRVNDYFAVEAAYLRMFEAKDTVDDVRVEVDGDSWELGTRFSYPVNERFSAFGRLGWSFYDFSADVSDEDLAFKATDSGDGLTWAVGGRVNLSQRLAVNGEYARILVDDADADFVSADLTYRFGRN